MDFYVFSCSPKLGGRIAAPLINVKIDYKNAVLFERFCRRCVLNVDFFELYLHSECVGFDIVRRYIGDFIINAPKLFVRILDMMIAARFISSVICEVKKSKYLVYIIFKFYLGAEKVFVNTVYFSFGDDVKKMLTELNFAELHFLPICDVWRYPAKLIPSATQKSVTEKS